MSCLGALYTLASRYIRRDVKEPHFMKINIRLLVFFVGVYLVALIALTPLNWIQQYAEPVLRAQGVRIQETQGNIWQGSSQLSMKGIQSLKLDWDAHPLGLFIARLPIDVHLSNPHLDLAGQVQLKPTGVSLQAVSGYIDEPVFARFAQAYGATIQGRLVASDLAASVGWRGSLGDASGDLSWSGGPVDVKMGRSSQTFDVPQMQGDILSDDNAWLVNIAGLDNTPFITAELARDGNAQIKVQRVLAERMNIPIPGGGRDTLVEMTQKVF